MYKFLALLFLTLPSIALSNDAVPVVSESVGTPGQPGFRIVNSTDMKAAERYYGVTPETPFGSTRAPWNVQLKDVTPVSQPSPAVDGTAPIPRITSKPVYHTTQYRPSR